MKKEADFTEKQGLKQALRAHGTYNALVSKQLTGRIDARAMY